MSVPPEMMEEQLPPEGEMVDPAMEGEMVEPGMEEGMAAEEIVEEEPGEEEFLGPSGTPRARGTADDAARESADRDPLNNELVTEDEQAQYEDFVSRAILMISDTRKPDEETPSPADATLKIMNNRKFTVPQALGLGAARTTMLIHNNAMRQDVKYDADVLFHGADELIAALYIIGNVAGIFEGVEPVKVPEDGNFDDYEFSEAEIKLLQEAKMNAVHEFGLMLEQSGQITEEQMQEAQDFWKSQIEREVESGEVGDDILSGIDVPAARSEMSKRMEGRGNGS